VFGNQHLVRFLDLFAGTHFEVRIRSREGTALRDADIYQARRAQGHRPGLATKYGVEEHRVADSYARVAALVGVTKGQGRGRVSRPA